MLICKTEMYFIALWGTYACTRITVLLALFIVAELFVSFSRLFLDKNNETEHVKV